MKCKKNPRSSLFALAAVVLALTPIQPVDAQTLIFTEDFEGLSLSTMNNQNNWQVANTSGVRGAVVIEGSSPNGAAPNQQIVHYFNQNEGTTPNDAPSILRRNFVSPMNEAQTHTIQPIEATFKIRANQLGQVGESNFGNHYVILRNAGTSTAGRFMYGPDGFRIRGSETAVGVSPTFVSFGTMNVGVWYEVTLHANPVTQQFWASVVNLNDPSQTMTSPTMYFDSNTTLINRISFESGSITKADVNFSDVSVYAIPEPATVGLLAGIGVLLMAIRFRRKQK